MEQPVVRFHSISVSLRNMGWTFNIHSMWSSALFLKETERQSQLCSSAQPSAICACPVTLSSSSNSQTCVQFKLAGHGPVTYFPHNMLCNIRDEALCHQKQTFKAQTQLHLHMNFTQQTLGIMTIITFVEVEGLNKVQSKPKPT